MSDKAKDDKPTTQDQIDLLTKQMTDMQAQIKQITDWTTRISAGAIRHLNGEGTKLAKMFERYP